MRIIIDRRLLVFLTVFALAGLYTFSSLTDKTGQESAPSPAVPAAGLSTVDGATPARVVEDYGKLPLSFEENLGQTDAQVHFLSRGRGYTLFLTGTEAVLSLHRASDAEDEAAVSDVVRVQLVGADPSPAVSGQELLPGKSNYLIGNDPAQWRTGIDHYEKVAYREVYPGVDLVYYGTDQRQLEHDFVVGPGADPEQIRFAVEGTERLRLDDTGNLVASTSGGDVIFQAPVTYQDIEGDRRSVESRYLLLESAGEESGGERPLVGFELAWYDPAHPVVIDPVLSYATYLGGSTVDKVQGIAVDGSGQAFVTGYTQSTDFPTASAYDASHDGFTDAFVTVLNSAGSALVYSTYLGGSNGEVGWGIAVDGSGQAFVTGYTLSTDFPTVSAYQATHGGSFDAFVTVLNSAGSALVYSTYLGGSSSDEGYDIAVDGSGQAFISGRASAGFPTTPGVYQGTVAGSNDGFVAKVNPALSGAASLVYSTFVGGTGYDYGFRIAVDGSGQTFVTGRTQSTDFPTTASAYDQTANGSQDVFVTVLNSTGTAPLVYSTFLGGGGSQDDGRGIAVDGSGQAFVTGEATAGFPTTAGAYQTIGPSGLDAFVAVLNPALSGAASLVYSTFLGGNADITRGRGIAVDAAGKAIVFGHTEASDFPTVSAHQATHGGNSDLFIAVLDITTSTLDYSTYLGGSSRDDAFDLAVDASGNAYLGGWTEGNFPTQSAYDASFGGTSDGVVAKLAGVGAPLTVAVSVPSVTATYNQALTIPVSISEASGIIAAEVTVEYDTDLLTLVTPTGVTSTGTLTDGWSVEYNTELGAGTLEKVKIAVATDVNAVTGAATLVDIQFTVNNVRLPASSALTLSDVLLNDGDPANATIDGSVTLVGNDATIVFSSGGSPIPRESITVVVTDADADLTSGPGNDNVSVTITNLGNGDVINATFPEDGTTAGTFSLVVPTEFGLAAVVDATIQAQAGDDIDFTYVDQLDANGNGPIVRAIQANVIGGTDGTAEITQVTQPGDVVYIKVVDADLNLVFSTAETASVVVTSNNGESERVVLTEADVDDDVFFGSLNSAPGAAADTDNNGTINAQKGDVLTATYDDVVTAVGSQVNRVDTDQAIDPFGDADGNTFVQAFDAAQVLLHVLSPFLVGLELIQANVDIDPVGTGVTPFDASLILQKRVGLISIFPVQQATSLNNPQNAPSSPKKAVEQRGFVLAYTEGYVSVQADDRSDIISGDMLLAGIDGQVQLGAELDDFIVASQQTDEGLRILFAGAVAVDGPGELLRVYSGVGPNKAQLTQAQFNDGAITARIAEPAGLAITPSVFALHGNYPNPFNPETTIAFDVSQAGRVELQVFDVLGQSVRTLVAESLPAGSYQVVWNGLDESGSRVSSGVYFYRLQADNHTQMKRMLLLK